MQRGAILLALLLVVALALAPAVLAQSGGPYTLSWFTIDAGGGTSSGGNYTLSGTIGQPDAGATAAGAYGLLGGYWGGWNRGAVIYLPLVLKN